MTLLQKKRRYRHEKDLVSSSPEAKAFFLIFLIIFFLIGGFLFKFMYLNPTLEANDRSINQIPGLEAQVSKLNIQRPKLSAERKRLIEELELKKSESPKGVTAKLRLTQYMAMLESNGLICNQFKLNEPEKLVANGANINNLSKMVVEYNCEGDYTSYLKAFQELPILGDNVRIEQQKITRKTSNVNISGRFSYIERE